MDWSGIVSVISGTLTVVSFVSIFLKLGKEKGTNETIQSEMKKDIDKNILDINNLSQKITTMEIENTKLISTLTSDLGWIKSSLSDIKLKISKME